MLENKTALITGASRGIGKAIALKFASMGANIAIVDYSDEATGQACAKEISALGVKASFYRCNVSNFDECGDVVGRITEDFGTIDILVNNAGITKDNLLIRMSESDFDAVIDVNLKGAFNMIRHTYSQFMKKRYGKIINMASVSGIMGNAGQANYSASKAGLIALTKTVAKELAGRNVCCNAIAPGFVATEMTEKFQENEELIKSIPLKRMGKPEDIANLAAFLADDLSDYITGEVIRIDGGMAM